MVSDSISALETFLEWAKAEESIVAVAIFGSFARVSGTQPADQWSDIDLHVTTTAPHQFSRHRCKEIFSQAELLAHINRPASGGVRKVTILLFPRVSVDLVVIPAFRARVAKVLVSLSVHKHSSRFSEALNEMATVMRYGYRIAKGGRKWEKFYCQVVDEIQGTRLLDRSVLEIAEEVVCDYNWVMQKIERGELVAAQRMIHRSLVEANIRLLHELRLRKGLRSFREARRVENLLSADELALVSVNAVLNSASLKAAADHLSYSCRRLMRDLVGESWRWPLDSASP